MNSGQMSLDFERDGVRHGAKHLHVSTDSGAH